MPRTDTFEKVYNELANTGLEVSPGIFYNNLHNPKFFNIVYDELVKTGLTIPKDRFKEGMGIGDEVQYMYNKEGQKVTPEQFFNKTAPTTDKAPVFQSPNNISSNFGAQAINTPIPSKVKTVTPPKTGINAITDLSKFDNLPKKQDGSTFRLPTAQEWENISNEMPRQQWQEISDDVRISTDAYWQDVNNFLVDKDPPKDEYTIEQHKDNPYEKYKWEKSQLENNLNQINAAIAYNERQLNIQRESWDNKPQKDIDILDEMSSEYKIIEAQKTDYEQYQQVQLNKLKELQQEAQALSTNDPAKYEAELSRINAEAKVIQDEMNNKIEQINKSQIQFQDKYNNPIIDNILKLKQKQSELSTKAFQLIEKPEYTDIKAQQERFITEQKKSDISEQIREKYINGELTPEEINKYREDGTLQNHNAQAWLARTTGKFLSDILSLPRTGTGLFEGNYGWADKLAEWANRVNDNLVGNNPYSSNLNVKGIQETVQIGDFKVLLDDGIAVDVRDKNNFAVSDEKRKQILDVYDKSPDKYPASKEFNTNVMMKNALNTITDMGIMIAGSKGTGTILKAGTTGQKFITASAIFGQTHNDIYKQGIEAGLNPKDAARYATMVSTSVALVSYLNPMEYKLAGGSGNGIMSKILNASALSADDVALANTGKLTGFELAKKYTTGVIKNVVGENIEEQFLEPLAQDAISTLYEKQGNFEQQYNPSLEETALVSLTTLPFGFAEVNSEMPSYHQQALMRTAENPEKYLELMQEKLSKGFITQQQFDKDVQNMQIVIDTFNAISGEIDEDLREPLIGLIGKKQIIVDKIRQINDDILSQKWKQSLEKVNADIQNILGGKVPTNGFVEVAQEILEEVGADDLEGEITIYKDRYNELYIAMQEKFNYSDKEMVEMFKKQEEYYDENVQKQIKNEVKIVTTGVQQQDVTNSVEQKTDGIISTEQNQENEVEPTIKPSKRAEALMGIKELLPEVEAQTEEAQTSSRENLGNLEAEQQTETTPNVEAKKADMERRRKENPSVERGVLINYESGKTKEQLIDIVSKLKEGKITFDEIVEEFFNLPTNTLLEVKKAFNEGTLADKIQFGLDVNELSEVQSKTRSKEEVIKSRQKALSEKQKAETALKDSEYKIVKKKEPITGKVTETKVKRTVEEKAKYEDFYRKIIEDTNKQIEEYDAELKALENNTQNETKQSVSADVEAKKANIERRRQEDFANENEFYRVIVGDEAFNDIVESGVVRTNAETKSKKEGGIDLSNRPTAYPSFSKGKASMDYAAENPNNYIIVTEDSSIQPSKAGRHGKGTTMFPTDENGNHLKELSGEKVKVYKHVGNGEYVLVYANGKEINAKYDAESAELGKIQPKETIPNVEAETKAQEEETKKSEPERSIQPKEQDTVTLPPIREGGMDRNMVFSDGKWQMKVGGELTNVSEQVQKEANDIFIQNNKSLKEQPTDIVDGGDLEIKRQIEAFGVNKDDVAPVQNIISKVYDGLKKTGLTAAETVGEWVGIGKGEEKPYSLKIDGKEVKVKNIAPEIVNGFYSPIEKKLLDEKATNLSATKWLERLGKGDEMQFTGLKDFLESKNPNEQVKKSELQDFMKDNRIEVVEVVKLDRPFREIKKAFENVGNEWEEVYGGVYAKLSDKSNEYERRYNLKINGVEYGRDFTYLDAKSYVEANAQTNPEKNRSKFSQYQLEGQKENYKEVLVTLPIKIPNYTPITELPSGYDITFDSINNTYAVIEENQTSGKSITGRYHNTQEDAVKNAIEVINAQRKNVITGKAFDNQFKSTHFDEPNILVHLRMNTRTDADGNKVLFLEEVQSDFGQSYKKDIDNLVDFVNKNEEKVIEAYKKNGKLRVEC